MKQSRLIPNSVRHLIYEIIRCPLIANFTIVKGYIRKSNVLFAMRDYTQAIEAIQEAEEHDEEHKHKTEIQQQIYKCQQALFTQRSGENEEETLQRAMRDPEIAVSLAGFITPSQVLNYLCRAL